MSLTGPCSNTLTKDTNTSLIKKINKIMLSNYTQK